jgi:hypothetical protein
VPGALLLPSAQTGAPLVQTIVPFLQAGFGLVVHVAPLVHATQLPALLQTMFVPQLAPAPFCVPLLQTTIPVVQLTTPVKQGSGLLPQL